MGLRLWKCKPLNQKNKSKLDRSLELADQVYVEWINSIVGDNKDVIIEVRTQVHTHSVIDHILNDSPLGESFTVFRYRKSRKAP